MVCRSNASSWRKVMDLNALDMEFYLYAKTLAEAHTRHAAESGSVRQGRSLSAAAALEGGTRGGRARRGSVRPLAELVVGATDSQKFSAATLTSAESTYERKHYVELPFCRRFKTV